MIAVETTANQLALRNRDDLIEPPLIEKLVG